MKMQAKWLWAMSMFAIVASLFAFGVKIEYVLLIALLLLCPAMMLFMRGGSDEDRSQRGARTASETEHPRRKSK